MTTPTQREKAERFRRLHEGPRCFVIPNPYDAGSARLLQSLGFEALATSSGACAGVLGRRDGKVSRDEALAHGKLIAEAVDLPVSADLERGFGDSPEDAALTITLAGAAGLVGGSIEDASGDKAKPIYDLAHAAERIAAAAEAANALDFPFTLTARAENFINGRADLDDTIRRLQAFEQAGADVLFAPACRISPRSARFARPCPARSTSWPASAASRSRWRSWRRRGAPRERRHVALSRGADGGAGGGPGDPRQGEFWVPRPLRDQR